MRNFFVLFIFFFAFAFSEAQTIEKTYIFNDLSISKIDAYDVINFNNTILTGPVGEPALPYHSISLLLPPGQIAESIEIIGEEKVDLKGSFNIYPQQQSRPLSEGASGKFVKKDEIYNSNNTYPLNLAGELSTEFLNGYSFALSTFTPVQYNPASGKLSYFKKITVKINTGNNSAAVDALQNISSAKKIINRLKRLSQNPEILTQYPNKGYDNDTYQMLIITKAQFENSFQDLIDLYIPRGIITQVETVENIYSSMPGQDNPEKIRNYIIQEYQSSGIEYVMLGGDVEIVPYRGFYCHVQSSSVYEDDNIPADLYYSALDGTWNDDGDNLWGEIGEDDLLPEVSVARYSFSNITELNSMMNKSVSYQSNPVLGELRQPLLAGELLWNDPITWGADYLELIIGYHEDNGYITDGIPEDHDYITMFARDQSWGGSDMINKINSGVSFVHHVGHANYNTVMNLNISEITNSNFAQTNGIDHNYTTIYSHGCNCGGFDANDCIGEKMVKIDNFAAAFVGNSRYSWYNEGWNEGPTQHLHREFTDALYHDRLSHIGTAHVESKIESAPWVNAPGQWEEGALRWCFYDCNVLGDPAMMIWTDEPVSIDVQYEEVISMSVQNYQTEVSSDGQALENMTCLLMKEGIVYGVGKTDEYGIANIVIDPVFPAPGEAQLIVSGYNCLPETFDLTVIPIKVTQTINLNIGYQFISSRIEVENPDMLVVLQDILNENLEYVRNTEGKVLRKIGPIWVNGIGNWIGSEGYLFIMNGTETLELSGEEINPLTPISLQVGYQFVSYLPAESIDAMLAFESIISDNLDYIRNSDGGMLRKIGPNWVNGIGNANPTEGYLIKMYSDDELVYNIPGEKALSNLDISKPERFTFKGGNAADPVYTIYFDGLEIGDEIAAFDGDKIVGALSINSDDLYSNALAIFNTINSGHGYSAGNQMLFKLWKNSEEKFYYTQLNFSNPFGDAYTDLIFPENDGEYSIANVKITENQFSLSQAYLGNIYPNPVSETAEIEFGLNENSNVELNIYNLLGEKVITLVNKDMTSGVHKFKLNCSDLKQGIYQYKIVISAANESFVQTKKMIISH